ncbi:histidine kinase dimerization/phospho-acceptor domain-containing protein [Corticibacterium sp. UT-5YL-CI-8]|nr:histidine kinase dimerization/phospho-acceptor domain-containing protein [Tianweitania sp. UT-5YL-CI-8]
MPSAAYSFLDVAILDQVRQRFAAGDALAILSTDLDQVIWANGPGAAIFGHDAVEDMIGASSRLGLTARRQIAATSGFPDIGRDRSILVRLATGMQSRAIAFLASAVTLPDGEQGILLAVPAAQTDAKDEADIVRHAVGGFSEPGHFLAFLDAQGQVEAASDGFSSLSLEPFRVAQLVAEFGQQGQRLLKRVLSVPGGRLPVGVARLTDDPVRYLLVVVDERDHAARESVAPVEEPKTASVEVSPAIEQPPVAATVSPVPEHASTPPAEKPATLADGLHDDAPAVRFVWRTDAEGLFSAISPEFAGVVGERAADVIGRLFHDVSMTFALDPDEEITALLERRDTWSGKMVLWPVAGTDRKVPVDLAALPVYSRDRVFEGFRGFGVLRPSESVVDPERIGLALVPNARTDEVEPEVPVTPADEPEVPATPDEQPAAAENVIRLAAHRPADAYLDNGKTLSPVERTAFREIGDRLRKTTGSEPPVLAPEPDVPARAEPADMTPQQVAATTQEAAETLKKPAVEYVPPQIAEVPQAESSEETVAAQRVETALPVNAPEETSVAEDVSTLPRREEAVPEPSAEQVEADAEDHPPADNALLERMPLPVLIHSGDRLHYANPEFLALIGHASLDDIEMAGGLGSLFVDHLSDVVDADRHLKMRGRDGAEFAVEALLRSVPWRGRKALMLVVKPANSEDDENVAGAASMVSALQTRVAEMRAIIDTATDGVVLIDLDGNIRSISRPAEALFGQDSDEVAGKPFTALFAIESQRAVQDYLNGLADNGVASVLNDGRNVIGREAEGGFIPMFMSIGKLPHDSGYCAVVRDITPWKRAEEELTQARSIAERASSQKTDFLARISHEIRTPLNAIIGFSELMMDEKFGPVANDRYRDYLRDINRSGNHVLDLVNDLLDISKIEAGQQEMDYEAVSINDVLSETVALMQPQANRERVIIRSSFASRLPEVVADMRSLRQIALNVLSNAVRYTQAGGQVIVSTSYEPSGDIALRVRDTGVGMTQAEIEQAMKPFKQINSLKRPRGDGTGLGLPLTKAMVEANRARFTITSTPGEGTLVEVIFPSTRVLAE